MQGGIVETEQGTAQGFQDGRAWAWLGLPYAAPPVGENRFRAPQPALRWTGTRDASRAGPAAHQPAGLLMPRGALGSCLDEDCLFLNVWSPGVDGRRRPVMVWIHGGGFTSGSGALYQGGPLAVLGDIVVVTINYRIGVFGFVDFGTALGDDRAASNPGFRDVIAGLRWVQANIAGFGGNPDRVTVAGESAGSILVSLLLLADAARPLLHGAIMQSGTFTLVHGRARAKNLAADYLGRLGVDNLSALQALPAARLLDVQQAVALSLRGSTAAAPWFDGDLLPAARDAAAAKPTAPVPLLIGSNRDEIVLFQILARPEILRTRREPLLDLVDRDLPAPVAAQIRSSYPDNRAGTRQLGTDLNFGMPTIHFAARHAAQAPVWLYRFDYAHPLFRACHALELLFLWRFPGVVPALLRGGFLTGLRSGLSERMRSAWTTFVRTGAPGDDWPAHNAADRRTRLFDLQDRIVSDPDGGRRAIWAGADAEPGR